jgi:hypothetical protein
MARRLRRISGWVALNNKPAHSQKNSPNSKINAKLAIIKQKNKRNDQLIHQHDPKKRKRVKTGELKIIRKTDRFYSNVKRSWEKITSSIRKSSSVRKIERTCQI